ncbi:MAG: DUF1573 domain-containing protein, partial [Chlorobia bacterium]|nr:DUF1573 domain-containing protein [Fimbriimonadaceae bacterium]
MILAILAAGAFQTSFGPALPMGTSPDLYKAFNQVKQEMANGRFDAAKQKLQLLPGSVVTYSWNDQNVPQAKRAELVEIRTQAFRAIANRIPGLSFKAGPKPAIKFTFEKSLANDPTSGLPRGVALFFSDSFGEPRLEAVIGLNRGIPLELTSNISLHNEVMFAAASYLGLAPGAFLGTMMGRVDLQMQYQSNVDVSESATIVAIRDAVTSLRQAVDKKQRLSPGNPKASFTPTIIERGPIIQGVPIEFSVQVSNLGDAPLNFRVIPDCGCVNATGPAIAAPGSSVLVKIRVDTTEILGDLNKHLILFSNDSEIPVQKFPIHVRTTPRYRFLSQEPNVLIVGDTGLDTELFLVSPKEKPLDIKSIEIVGNSGTATFEPWEGELPDPDLNEVKKLRSGYRLKIHLDEPGVSGRSAAV